MNPKFVKTARMLCSFYIVPYITIHIRREIHFWVLLPDFRFNTGRFSTQFYEGTQFVGLTRLSPALTCQITFKAEF